jgi:hypothetical protein
MKEVGILNAAGQDIQNLLRATEMSIDWVLV